MSFRCEQFTYYVGCLLLLNVAFLRLQYFLYCVFTPILPSSQIHILMCNNVTIDALNLIFRACCSLEHRVGLNSFTSFLLILMYLLFCV